MDNTSPKPDGFDLAAQMRRSGIEWMSPEEVATLREYLRRKGPKGRVREVFGAGDALIEGPIDRLWGTLGRRPTPAEYRELAEVCRDAAKYCERAAKGDR